MNVVGSRSGVLADAEWRARLSLVVMMVLKRDCGLIGLQRCTREKEDSAVVLCESVKLSVKGERGFLSIFMYHPMSRIAQVG